MALDDSINNKTGRNIFGCSFFHDHTAKLNKATCPCSQNIVSIGLLKRVKLIANTALSKDFLRLCSNPRSPQQNAFISLLVRMVT